MELIIFDVFEKYVSFNKEASISFISNLNEKCVYFHLICPILIIRGAIIWLKVESRKSRNLARLKKCEISPTLTARLQSEKTTAEFCAYSSFELHCKLEGTSFFGLIFQGKNLYQILLLLISKNSYPLYTMGMSSIEEKFSFC